MKSSQTYLSSLVFIGALSSAFTFKPAADRNLYTKFIDPCHLISCRTTRIGNAIQCPYSLPKYTDPECKILYTGTGWVAFTE